MRAIMIVATVAIAATAGPRTRTARVDASAGQLTAARTVSGEARSTATVRIGVLTGRTYVATTVPLETYVARVLGGEAAPNTAPAALEALAIAVRTYVLANLARHRAEGFDLCDQTHCQVMRSANPDTERAAQATAGRVLLHEGRPASIFYSASCGGRTEVPSAVWPGADDPPFLPSREDDACGGMPMWSSELHEADLQRAFEAAGYRGTLRSMRIASRNRSGRVARLILEGLTPGEISGQDLRAVVGRTLGWQRVMSASFDLRRAGRAYRFTGHGSGHGVGMCVIGSMRLAAAGQSAQTILNRYYPGLTIVPIGPSTIVPTPAARPPAPPIADPEVPRRTDLEIILPPGDAQHRDTITKLVALAREDLARALDVAAPPRVTVRFHSATADYERTAGRPWFTSGAVVSSEIHLLPISVLRDRGVLERTLRHELVHLMTDSALRERPAWVREGIALHFADERPQTERNATRSAPRSPCPGDEELLRPASAGALTDAYARARACVARQLGAGRTWRDVR
jgi:stage II sporulation protein D